MSASLPTERLFQALGALARKYRSLAGLRRARLRGDPVPDRAIFLALAGEFPGALRELDTLELDEIDARAEALERAAAGDGRAVQPWMAWLCDYHAWMRAALWIKLRVRRGARPDAVAVERIAAGAAQYSGLAVDVDFVLAVCAPDAKRLRPVVLDRVATAHGVAIDALVLVLFSRQGFCRA